MNNNSVGRRQCLNCFGFGHFSAECPFPPKCRRCFTCGRSGGKQNHRPECTDGWYDLTARVPRNPDGTQMERDQLLEVLSAEFYAEQARRRQNVNSVSELATTESRERQQQNVSDMKLERIKEKIDSNDDSQSENDDDESDEENVKSEEVSEPSVIVIDSDSDSERSENETAKEMQRLRELESQALETLRMIRDGMDALEAKGEDIKPRRMPLATLDQVIAGSRESNVSEKRVNKKMKANEVWERALKAPLPDGPSNLPARLLMVLTFQSVSQLHLAEQFRSEIQLGAKPIRMANGIWVNFDNSTLEIRGMPSRENRYQFLSVGDAFYFDLTPTSVTLNGEFLVSDDLMVLPRLPDVGFLPEHTITLFGPAQKKIKMMFKQRRYILTFNGGKLVMPTVE